MAKHTFSPAALLLLLMISSAPFASANDCQFCNIEAYEAGSSFSASLAYVFIDLMVGGSVKPGQVYNTTASYQDNVIYGMASCAGKLSHKACRSCLYKAVKKLHFCCGLVKGGSYRLEKCGVRYEIYEFDKINKCC